MAAARVSEREARRARLEDATAGSVLPALEGVRVLAVDDEPDSLDLVRAILERCNATVETVSDATTALRSLVHNRPDVLVADVAMPEHDGYWLIRQLRSLTPENGGSTPALALTAYARTEDRIALLEAGFQKHIAKPVIAERLLAAIADLAGRGITPRSVDEVQTSA
jgi:CheY-like chemotaxis protein